MTGETIEVETFGDPRLGLRFINYVTDRNSNAGYHNVISQFDEAFDEEEEEEDVW